MEGKDLSVEETICVVYKITADGHFTFVNSIYPVPDASCQNWIGEHFSHIVNPDDASKVRRTSVLENRELLKGTSVQLFDERRTGSRITENLKIRMAADTGTGFRDCLVNAAGMYDDGHNGESVFCGSVGAIRFLGDKPGPEEPARPYKAHQYDFTAFFIPDGTLLHVNDLLFSNAGSPGAIRSVPSIFDMIHPDDAQDLNSLVAAGLKKEVVREKFLARFRFNEDIRVMYVGIRCHYDSWGSIVGFSLHADDVTASYQTLSYKQAFDIHYTPAPERERRLEMEIESKNRYIAEIHHRVKNNLQVLIGLITIKEDEIEDRRDLDFILDIKQKIYSISLIHELLYRNTDNVMIPLAEYLSSLSHMLLECYSKEGTVKLRFDIREDVALHYNKARNIGIIFAELIVNAFKYAFTGKGGEITITIDTGLNGSTLLVVHDNGIGVSHPAPETDDTHGGLHLVRDIVASLAGEMEVETENGRTIFLTIPV